MPEDFDYSGIIYLEVCDPSTGGDASDVHNIEKGIRKVIQGDTKVFLYVYLCHSQDSRHWYYMRAIINFGIVAEIRLFDILCSKDISGTFPSYCKFSYNHPINLFSFYKMKR